MELFNKIFKKNKKQSFLDNGKDLNKNQKEINLNEKESRFKYCVNCGHKLNKIAKKCPYCNYNFKTQQIEKDVSNTKNNNLKENEIKNKIPNHLTIEEISEERNKRLKAKEEEFKKQTEKREKEIETSKKELAKAWQDLFSNLEQEAYNTLNKWEKMSPEEREKEIKRIESVDAQDKKRYIEECNNWKQYTNYMTPQEIKTFERNTTKIFKKDYNGQNYNPSESSYFMCLSMAMQSAYWDINLKYYHKGRELEKEKSIDKAIKQYEKCIRLKFDAPASYERLITIYSKRNDYKNHKRILEAQLDVTNDKDKIRVIENELYLIEKGGLENLTIPEVMERFEGYDLIKYSTKYYTKNKKDIIELNKLKPVLTKALTYKKLSDTQIANCYRLLGEIELSDENIDEALNYFEKSLTYNETTRVKNKYQKLLDKISS